ncbi:MAG: DsrE family protein [Rubrivivax sp.]|nr:DsrE family protein [Rubrivivax sp.]MBK7261137.1 DsrE family protein [Rubrivivax sp.]MBK8529792.1 DsrE family protein [Rubrivivax sp.]
MRSRVGSATLAACEPTRRSYTETPLNRPALSTLSRGALAIACSLLLSGAACAQEKVIFQVSDADPAKWNLTLNNIANVQKDLGVDKVQIEIVAYGPGIGMLKLDSVAATRVAEALRKGIQVVACQNTLTAQKLVHADMLANISYVPAGVVELMRKQQQGWAYIRP